MELTIDQALQKGIEAHKAGEFQEADRYYTAILKENPKHPNANHGMGVLAASASRLEMALPYLKNALEANPSISQFWLSYIDALVKLDRISDAKAVFDQAKRNGAKGDAFDQIENRLGSAISKVSNVQEPPKAQLNALIKLYNQNKLIQVFDEAQKLTKRYTKSLALLNLIGASAAQLGRLDDAILAFQQALSIKPDYADAYNNMGIALEGLGRMDESVSNFQKAFAFRSGIVPKGDKALAPATTALFFELTNKCNFHCVFCPSDSQKRNLGSMNLELVKRLYTEASEKKLANVVNLHLMGEPTLHPQLIEILKFGASKNIRTDLVTNGSTLVAKIVPKILDSLYGTIIASHMTPTKETYQFRGKVGLSWERYISNLRLLVREYMKRIAQGKICKNDITIRVMSTMNTSANCTITENTEEARAILKEWTDFVASVEEELGMDRFERVDYNTHDLLQENSSRCIDYPLQKGMKLTFWRAFTFANTRVSDEYELEDKSETGYCPHPFKDVGVLWNGDVTLCCLDHDGELSVGNINNSSIEEIIQNDAAKKLRASMLGRCSLPSVCKTCQAKPVKRQNADKVSPATA